MEMHHSPRTVPESSPRSVMFVEKMDSRTGLVPSSNWLIGLDSMDVCKDEKRVNFTYPNWPTEPRGVVIVVTNTDNLCPLKEQPNHHQQPLPHPNEHNEHEDNVKRNSTITLGDLHRDHLAHHGPSVLIQLGPTVTNNISDLWWPRPTHHHSYPSCPSGTTTHAGPDTLVVANTHQEVIQDCTSTPISPNEYHHGFHPTTVCKIPPG